jgi:hypothetical protein
MELCSTSGLAGSRDSDSASVAGAISFPTPVTPHHMPTAITASAARPAIASLDPRRGAGAGLRYRHPRRTCSGLCGLHQFFVVVLVRQFVPENGLSIVQAQPKAWGNLGWLEMDGHYIVSFFLGEVQFPSAVLRGNGVGRDEVENLAAALNGASQRICPFQTGANAFVVPQIDTMVIEPGDFAVNGFRVLVVVAHEYVGIISLVR